MKKKLFRIILLAGVILFAIHSICLINQLFHRDLVNDYNGNIIRDFIKSLLELVLILFVLYKPKMYRQLGLLFLIEAVFHEFILSSGFVTIIFTAILCSPYVVAAVGCLRKKNRMIMIGAIWGMIDQCLIFVFDQIDYYVTAFELFSTFSVIGYRVIIYLMLILYLLSVNGKLKLQNH